MRTVGKNFKNTTVIIGDSNTKHLKFSQGKKRILEPLVTCSQEIELIHFMSETLTQHPVSAIEMPLFIAGLMLDTQNNEYNKKDILNLGKFGI